MEILNEIKNRKSPIVFKEDEVEKEKIDAIIEAARWAPSCFNKQPWNYTFVHRGDKTRESFVEAFSVTNGWARKAPYIVAVSANMEDDCQMNGVDYALYDTGLSVMNLNIEAEHQGLRVHHMAGWNSEKVKKALDIPENQKVIVIFALGYGDNPKRIWDKLSDKLREKVTQARTRKKSSENFFFGEFGKN